MSSESLSSAAEQDVGDEEEGVGLLGSGNNMEARAEHQKTKNYNVLYGITTFFGVGLVILVVIWLEHFRGGFAWSSNRSLEFNWHPLLMVLGLIFLYSQSILLYRTGRKAPKKPLKIAHAVLHCLAFIFSVIGLKAVFDSHNLVPLPIPNLYSLHSWIGLLTVILFAAQFVFGFVSFLFPGLSPSLRAAILPVHVSAGAGIFCMALISCISGLMEKTYFSIRDTYSQLPPEGVLINFIALFLTFFGVLTLYLVSDIGYKRIALPEESIGLTGHGD